MEPYFLPNDAVKTIVYIPNFNGERWLPRTLQSLRGQTERLEVVVVDNGSSDGSAAAARADFPEATVLELGENLGFGPALNRAVATHPADGIVLLNSDVECEPEFCAQLLAGLDEGVEMVAAVLLQEHEPGLIDSAGVVADSVNGATVGAGAAASILNESVPLSAPAGIVGAAVLAPYVGNPLTDGQYTAVSVDGRSEAHAVSDGSNDSEVSLDQAALLRAAPYARQRAYFAPNSGTGQFDAFNQILSIQPTNFEAADALAAQYETMKRWPDLISLLRKKAAAVETPAEKVALHLRGGRAHRNVEPGPT